MSCTTASLPEPTRLHSIRDHRPRLDLCNNKNREEQRAWYKRWLRFPSYIWSTSALRPLDSYSKPIIPAKQSQSQSPNLDEQISESTIPNPNAMQDQHSNWTAGKSTAEGNEGDGKLATPQYPSNFVIKKERKLSGCDTTSESDEPASKEEVKPPDIQYYSPIPSINNDQPIFDPNSDSHQSASEPGRGITSEPQPESQITVDRAKLKDFLIRPSSSSDTPSDPISDSYQYTADKSDSNLDYLNFEYTNVFHILSNTDTRVLAGTSPEHDAHRYHSSANPNTQTTRPRSFLIPEHTLFFAPEPCVLSDSSQGPTITPRSSYSSISIYTEPRPLQQLQVGSAVQEGSILSSAINTLVDDAMVGYNSSLPMDDFATFAHKSSNPSSSSPTAELENRFTALINVRDALLLRRLAVATDIGAMLELLMPKIRLYVKDEATLTRIYEEIQSIKHECLEHQLGINFHALEFLSSVVPVRNPSIQQKIEALQRELQPFFDQHQASTDAGLRFIGDPTALVENRLGVFSMSQR